MNDPWFEPNRWAWLPGTLLGVFGGLWGSLAGILAPQGKARSLVLGLGWLFAGVSLILLAMGMIALFIGQPYGVWYGLGLAGLIGSLVVPPNLAALRRVYRQAEERRMQAEDFR
ncbi:MAG TPA: hypothetical protein VMF69_08330 [Gemmataceae bacterium]|nr:hypothetical protein [Gemmataceae bacterium]